MDLRLTGTAVRVLRRLSALPGLGQLLWQGLRRDLGIDRLRSQAPMDLPPPEIEPRPIQARTHGWNSLQLGTPAVTGGRSTGNALRRGFASGASPVVRLEQVLSAHAAAGPRSPFIHLLETRARQQATASEARWRAGRTLGPLDGLLVPIKDHFSVRGEPTWGGTRFLGREIPAADAWVIERLDAAGAILVATTHATELGINALGLLEHRPGPRNAYANDRAPGGSSTGSGVSVALGWSPSSVGSDGGGSIRIPASWNGVFGLKPTFQRVSSRGDRWAGTSMGHTGPIGQSTQDLVELLAAISGLDSTDPFTAYAPDQHASAPWFDALGRGLRGAKLGVVRSELAAADPAIAGMVDAALRAFESEGAVLVDVEIPLAPAAGGIGCLVIGTEVARLLEREYVPHGTEFGDELTVFFHAMRRISPDDSRLANACRMALRLQAAAVFAKVDLLVLPSNVRPAPHYRPDEDCKPILHAAAAAEATRFHFLANLTGLPAGTLPMGMVDGLPVGLQVVGDAWDEASVFALLAHAERMGLTDAVARPQGFLGVPDVRSRSGD